MLGKSFTTELISSPGVTVELKAFWMRKGEEGKLRDERRREG